MNRRSFLNGSAAGALAFPYVAASTVLGANDRLHVGFVGLGGRASALLRNREFGKERVVAVADLWPARLKEAAEALPGGDTWKKYPSHRHMLDKERLDAVFVETMTHARVLVSIHCLQAGCDVYAEKPLTLTIEEGQVLTKAVRRYKRVLQTGTQQRSMPINIYASNLVASGKLGKIEKVIVCNFLGPKRWESKPAQAIPEGLNWDLWCNQTELRPYHTDLHRRWSRWWDYDGGGMSWGVTGWGTHSLDQVQAALGTSLTGPVEIDLPRGPGENAVVAMKYANGTVVSLEQEIVKDHQQLGAIFIGAKGRMQILRGDFKPEPEELKKGAPEFTKEGPGENAPHLQNFFDCIRSRQRPNADVEIGHRSNTVCHLVNICRDLGRKLRWDPKRERFIDDEQANKMMSRPRRKGYELPSIA